MAILEAAGTISEEEVDGRRLTEGAIAAGYQNFLICCEMLLGRILNILTISELFHLLTDLSPISGRYG